MRILLHILFRNKYQKGTPLPIHSIRLIKKLLQKNQELLMLLEKLQQSHLPIPNRFWHK